MSSMSVCTLVVATMVVMVVPNFGNAVEFAFVRATSTSACLRFRNSSSQDWGYLHPSYVTQQTAQHLCHTYVPSAVTGVVLTTYTSCRVSRENRYSTNVNCPYNATSNSDCVISGDTEPTYISYSVYVAAIECIITPTWSTSSQITASASSLVMGGTHGTATGRTVSTTSTVLVYYLRPVASFSVGSICMPVNSTTFDNNVAQSMCRTVGIPGSVNSTFGASTYSLTYPALLSNLECSSSDSATLWNGGCTYTTHYYDVVSGCAPYRPEASCPVSFDMRLSDPYPASSKYRGYQLVQLRAAGSDAYDGMMCLTSSLTQRKYVAVAVCKEMYGSDMDFAAYPPSYVSLVSTGTKAYLSSVSCGSASYTSLSQCSAKITPTDEQSICSYNGVVACTMNEFNTAFSLGVDSSVVNRPGIGYLMAAVTPTAQSAAAVCADGFDQSAVLATCRSLGYTPGPNALFAVSTQPSSYAVNNVTCPIGANKLSDCKLQYSGVGNYLSFETSRVCSGRVYLNCDLGEPKVEFRMASTRYLQARLYSNAEWGWVDVISGVSGQEAYDTMCSKSTSSTGDSTITRSYLSISSCPTGATSYTECTYTYTNGVADTRDYYCSPSYSTSGSADSGSVSSTMMILYVGAPLGFAVLVFVCIMANKKRLSNSFLGQDSEGMTTEMAPTHLPAPPENNTSPILRTGRAPAAAASSPTPTPTRATFSSSGATAYPPTPVYPNTNASGGGGVYGNHVSTPPIQAWNNTYAPNNAAPPYPMGFNHPHQPPPPTDYTSGGGIYGQPVLGTPYQPQQGGVFGGPPAPYPMGVPANHPPPFPSTSCDAAPSCGPTPYGRGSYD